MATCQYCGAKLPEGTKFCTECGSAVAAPKNEKTEQKPETAPVQENAENTEKTIPAAPVSAPDRNAQPASVKDKILALNDTPDTTADYTSEDIEKGKLMAVLAYIGPLVFVTIFCAKDSKFARFHANQGLVLLIVDILVGFLSSIPVIGWLADVLTFVLIVIGIFNAANGKAKEVPVLGKIRLLK